MHKPQSSEEDSDNDAHDVGGQVDDHDLLCHEKLNTSLSSNQDNTADSKINMLWHAAQSTLTDTKKALGFETIPTATASTLTVPPPVQHDILLQCPICLKTETTQKACIYHILSQHPDYRFMCSTCSKQFSTFYAKYRHKKEHSEPAHICTECGKAYPFNSELERHMGVHTQILPFGCDLCDKRFAQKKV